MKYLYLCFRKETIVYVPHRKILIIIEFLGTQYECVRNSANNSIESREHRNVR